MDKKQLQKSLNDQNINPRCYSLVAGNFDPDEALCLRQDGSEWIIFYSERGLQSGKQSFPLEDQACAYMLEQLLEDPTTRANWKSGFEVGASNGT
jgi:hypothetical protein